MKYIDYCKSDITLKDNNVRLDIILKDYNMYNHVLV